MTGNPSREFVWTRFAKKRGRFCAGSEIQTRGLRVIFCALSLGVELRHCRLVDFSFEPTQQSNRVLIERKSIQEHRIVTREEFLVVLEYDELVLLNLCVG